MATRIGVMYLGRLVEVAPAEELFRAPRHPYTRMLLDAVPDLDVSGRPRRPVEGEIPNPIDPPPGCAFHPRCPHANARCRAEQPQLTANGIGHGGVSRSGGRADLAQVRGEAGAPGVASRLGRRRRETGPSSHWIVPIASSARAQEHYLAR